MDLIKRAAQILWGLFYLPTTWLTKVSESQLERMRTLIYAFYVYHAYQAILLAHKLLTHPKFDSAPLQFLWLIRWWQWGDFTLLKISFCALMVGLSLAVLFYQSSRALRILLALTTLLVVALSQSYLKISHQWHLHLYALIMLSFLNYRKSQNLALTFFLTQYLILFTYSLSGFWKLSAGVYEWLFNEASFFSHYALAAKIAYQILLTSKEPLLAPWVLQYPGYWNALLWLGVYLEFFALAFVFKPRLHRLIGLALILMHIGNMLFLEVSFSRSIVVLGLFLIGSPFVPVKANVKLNLHSLPYWGIMLLYLKNVTKPKETAAFLLPVQPSKAFSKLVQNSRWVAVQPLPPAIAANYGIDAFSATLSAKAIVLIEYKGGYLCLKDTECYLWLLSFSPYRFVAWPLLLIPTMFLDFTQLVGRAVSKLWANKVFWV